MVLWCLSLAAAGAAAVAQAAAAEGAAGAATAAEAAPSRLRRGPTVTLADGSALEGVREAEHTHAFWGIPFAEPPVRALRWQPPRPHRGWNGTRPAAKEGAHCIQMHTPMYTSPGAQLHAPHLSGCVSRPDT